MPSLSGGTADSLGCSPWVCPQFITDRKDYLNVLFTNVMNYNKQKWNMT